MVDKIKDFTAIAKKLEDAIEKFNSTTQDLAQDVDAEFEEYLPKNFDKLSKKQKREAAEKILRDRMPHVSGLFAQLHVIAWGINDAAEQLNETLDDAQQTLSSAQDQLEEIERLKESL